MGGTREGGLKAAITNKQRHGEAHYARAGHAGGKAKVPKGFAVNRELARIAGAKGGSAERRKRNET
jgi:general stress protein YciG